MSNSINFSQSVYANNFNKPNSYKYVYDVTGNYNVWTTIVAAWNQKMTEAGEDGIYLTGNNQYTFTTKDTDWVVESITGNLLVGTNLQVTYSGTNNFFRTGQTVTDDSFGGVQGQVISHGVGVVVLAPVNVAFVAATMFTSGMSIREFSFAAAFTASQGGDTLFKFPAPDYDYAQTFRGTCSMAASDAQWTYIEYQGKAWYADQINEAIKQTEIERERQFILGSRNTFNGVGGTSYTTTSLKWAAQNRGGQYVPISSGLTFAQFNQILYNQQIKRAGNSGDEDNIILCGTAFLSYFQQNFVNQFVQYSGNRNTFGGETVKGLNVVSYSIMNKNYKLVVLPMFDDPNWSNVATSIPGYIGSRLSNSFFVIDPTMLQTYGGGITRPPVQEIYWGQRGMNAKVISGMVGTDLTMSNGMPSQGQFQNTSSSVDGMQIEVMQKCGQHIPSGKGITFVEAIV